MNAQLNTVITAATELGGACYPFLLPFTGWKIVSTELTDDGVAHVLDNSAGVTLRFPRNDSITDLIVPGYDTDSWLAATGLSIGTDKGLFTTTKRAIRALLRPYFIFAWFKPGEVRIKYDLDKTLADGGGQMSRSFARKMANRLNHLPENKRREMRRELLHGDRFEATIQGVGHDKCHVLIVDTDEWDFRLAPDTKAEISLSGRVFVGLNPVHGKDRLYVDGQSLINLKAHKFFGVTQLIEWTRQAGEIMLSNIERGDVAQLVGSIDGLDDDDVTKLDQWATREYLVSGGHPMHFSGIVRSLANQHIRMLESKNEAVRFRIPGFRRYLFCDIIGGLNLPSGTCHIDATNLFVSSADYPQFAEDEGGCDQDDNFLGYAFVDDADGVTKVMVWRNPNQAGERRLLVPDATSVLPQWVTTAGVQPLPHNDSRNLPPVISSVAQNYTGVVKENAALIALKGQPYSVALATPYILTALKNKGALGAYCNVLMVVMALWEQMPEWLPDLLSKVIDATVKTGDDVSAVLEWCEMAVRKMADTGVQVPVALAGRINGFVEDVLPKGFPATHGHWFDQLMQLADLYIVEFEAKRDALALKAVPPAEIIEAGRDWMSEGAKIRSAYRDAFRRATPEVDGFEMARRFTEPMFSKWVGPHLKNIVLGTIAQCYTQRDGNPRADAVLWQFGAKRDGVRQPGIAQLTLATLREVGLIGEPVISEDGFVLYYKPEPAKINHTLVQLNGVWFNLMPNRPATMGAVSKADNMAAKQRIAHAVTGEFVNKTLTIRLDEKGRRLAFDSERLFGYVSKDTAANVGDTITIVSAIADDGNLIAVVTTA